MNYRSIYMNPSCQNLNGYLQLVLFLAVRGSVICFEDANSLWPPIAPPIEVIGFLRNRLSSISQLCFLISGREREVDDTDDSIAKTQFLFLVSSVAKRKKVNNEKNVLSIGDVQVGKKIN